MGTRKKSLCLVTLNGKCSNQDGKMMKMWRDNVCKSEYGTFRIKNVRNFTTVELPKLKIFLCIYSRGSFKITLSQSNYFKIIINHIERVLEWLYQIIETFFSGNITKIETKITQLAITSGYLDSISEKLSYDLLAKKFPVKNNQITISVNKHNLIHTINWMNFECCGSSSFYFSVIDTNQKKSIGGIKLFNNMKMIIFIHQINQIEEMLHISEKLQHEVKGVYLLGEPT